MSTGVEDGGGSRSSARADGVRRVAFPALVLVLALFCVEGLQVLTAVVRNDLASPPLVDVPSIDLRSSPPPTRSTAVAGIVVESGPATEPAPTATELAAVVPPEAIEASVALDAPGVAAVPEVAVADPVVAGTLEAPGPLAAVAPVAVTIPGAPAVSAASAGDDDRGRRDARKGQGRANGRSASTPQGPPPGRPVGPDCVDVPGRRAACDRRPQTD